MLLFNMCEGPKKIWHHFGLFLSLFSAFHLKFLQLCKKPQSYISGTHQLLFPLVNNGQNWCQKLWTFFSPLLILQGECEQWCRQVVTWTWSTWRRCSRGAAGGSRRAPPPPSRTPWPGPLLRTLSQWDYFKIELQTKVREDFTIMEKAPSRPSSWLTAPSAY